MTRIYDYSYKVEEAVGKRCKLHTYFKASDIVCKYNDWKGDQYSGVRYYNFSIS